MPESFVKPQVLLWPTYVNGATIDAIRRHGGWAPEQSYLNAD